VLAAILLGPTIVDEQEGDVTRPSMMFLLDGSQSMKLGQDETRWGESLRFISEAESLAGESHSGNCQSFRFGHRLGPLHDSAGASTTTATGSQSDSPSNQGGGSIPSVTKISAAGDAQQEVSIAPPEASDSRLGDALRQLLPQVSAKSSAGVVLLSDGRVRASESVERLAEFFGESQVPIHVVPVGQATGTGDIAVVSLVVPSRVRKFTENELQVFLRSFGFTGGRTTARVNRRQKIGNGESTTLASVPITLGGGAQSVSLKFRVNEQPENLEIVIDPIDGELTKRNNRVTTRVEIDRTKVRVLYVNSDAGADPRPFFSRVFGGGTPRDSEPQTALTVKKALEADQDVGCTVVTSVGGQAPRLGSQNGYASDLRFLRNRAELFAYDCVVFCNVGPNVLSKEQNEWLSQWIEGRGGGLIVAGGEALRPEAWVDSPLLPLLPLNIENVQLGMPQAMPVEPSLPQHPVWRLRLERQLNDELLSQLPSLTVSGLGYEAKSTAEVLARQRAGGDPVLLTHRAGRGRVLVSAASLGGRSLSGLAEAWGPQGEHVAAKFWRNMVYWVTEGSSTGRRRLVAESDKRFYRPGEPLTILAKAYDEGARRTQKYRVRAMFEPASLDDMKIYSPILWPDNVVRESGEVGPRIAWGEEMPLKTSPTGDGYLMKLMLSETERVGDSGLRIEMTAYEGAESKSVLDHGTQVDSTSLAIQILSDPFEQQNPLPNHELLTRLAAVSGGQVLESPSDLARLMENRQQTHGPPKRDLAPAWNRWWLWLCLLGLLSVEWIWRRVTGLA
jgi:hypothetical protein